MSWLTSAVKSVRKDLHIPPITIGNIVKAGAAAGVPGLGSVNAALDATKKNPSKPASFTDSLHTAFDNVVHAGTEKVQEAQMASDAVETVKAHGPLIIVGALAVIYFATRKR